MLFPGEEHRFPLVPSLITLIIAVGIVLTPILILHIRTQEHLYLELRPGLAEAYRDSLSQTEYHDFVLLMADRGKSKITLTEMSLMNSTTERSQEKAVDFILLDEGSEEVDLPIELLPGDEFVFTVSTVSEAGEKPAAGENRFRMEAISSRGTIFQTELDSNTTSESSSLLTDKENARTL